MFTAQVITVSDRCYRGEQTDKSGPAIKSALETAGFAVKEILVLPDEQPLIAAALISAADETDTALVVTTGGTGFAPRDVTPEATVSVVEKNVPGIPEAMRSASLKITSRACLSRGAAGIRKKTLIINLPGSPKAAVENLSSVLPALTHGLVMLRKEPMDCAALDDA